MDPDTLMRRKQTPLDPRKRVRVSVNLPDDASNVVLNNTPLDKPIFTKRVGLFLSILSSTISATEIDDGDAVRAC